MLLDCACEMGVSKSQPGTRTEPESTLGPTHELKPMNLRSSNVPPHPYHFQPALAASYNRRNPTLTPRPAPRTLTPTTSADARTRTHNRTPHPEPITATTHQPLAVRSRDQTCTCEPLALTPTPTLTLMLTLIPNLNSLQSRSFTNDLVLAFPTLNISLLQTIATTRAICHYQSYLVSPAMQCWALP